jgi:hypothetical protein
VALSRLSILVFPQTPKTWTARCLEHDLAASGRTAEAAIDTLIRIAQAHIAFDARHGREPLSAFHGAPRQYWSAFAQSKQTERPLEVRRSDTFTEVHCKVGLAAHDPILRALPIHTRTA